MVAIVLDIGDVEHKLDTINSKLDLILRQLSDDDNNDDDGEGCGGNIDPKDNSIKPDLIFSHPAPTKPLQKIDNGGMFR